MHAKVNADHASDTVMRCSRTGVFGLFKLWASILVEQEAKFCGVFVLWVQIYSNETML